MEMEAWSETEGQSLVDKRHSHKVSGGMFHLLTSLTEMQASTMNFRSAFCRNTAQWFGVGENCETKQHVWHRKSLRHCSQRYGKLKAQYRESETATSLHQSLDSPAAHKMPKVLTD